MAKKLLVADDSLTIQKVIKLALSGDGYEIQTVSDGTECLQQVALFRPDVVLIDIGLPGRSAFELKMAANEDPEMSRIPFVLMSSAFEKVDEAKVALLRFDGRLTKPFDPSNLKGVLTAALQMNSGQTLKEFTPQLAPSNTSGFSLEPSEKSRQLNRTSFENSDSDVTGEISLLDPKLIHSDPPATADSLWSDSPSTDPLNLESEHSSENSDIRNLTESTVKMSGLDDLGGWNIEENSKTSLPPIPDMFTQTGFSKPDFNPTPFNQAEISMGDDPLLDLEMGSPTPAPARAPTPPPSPRSSTPTGTSTSIPSQASIEGVVEKQVRERIESLVQIAVKAQLEQMARKALPDIAERIVKAEIRKMLEGLSGSND